MENLPNLDKMLALRLEYAELLGSASWAECILANAMAGSPAAVSSFLDAVEEGSQQKAAAEANRILTLKKQEQGSECEQLDCSDRVYYAGRDQTHLAAGAHQYFSSDCLMNGIRLVLDKLYALEVVDLTQGILDSDRPLGSHESCICRCTSRALGTGGAEAGAEPKGRWRRRWVHLLGPRCSPG